MKAPISIPTFVLLETKNRNFYGFNILSQKCIYLPPLMAQLIKHYFKEGDFEYYQNYCNANSCHEFDGIKYTKDEIDYYIGKILFFEKGNLFQKGDFKSRINKELTAEDVLYNISNSKHIGFEVTEKCNLDCKYCIYGENYNHYERRDNKNLDFNKAKRLIDYMFELWCSSNNQSINTTKLISFYGGEPLLNFELIERVVDYINEIKHKYSINIQYNITTNATLLHKHIDYLVENDFRLTISLDGDAHHNSYRVFKDGSPSYDIVLNNTLSILKKYPSYFIEKVHFNSVLHKNSDYIKIREFFKENFNKETEISELNPLMNNSSKALFKSILSEVEKSGIDLNQFNIHPDIKSKLVFLSLASKSRFDSYFDLLEDENYSKCYLPTGTCLPFSNKIFITVNGNIYPCETIPHDIPLGKVDNSTVQIDNLEIANKYNSLYNSISNRCSVCYNFNNCTACIFLDLFKELNCPYFSSIDKFSRNFSSEIEFFESNPIQYSKILNSVHNG